MAASAVAAAALTLPDRGFARGLDAAAGLRDPVPASEAAVDRGRAFYRARCAACHGERGRGDGASGQGLDPRPADLVLHVPQHTDGELFYFIGRGVPGSAMPAWRSVLSERDRWDLVHYLRALADGRP